MKEDFQSEGKVPDWIERLKICTSGVTIEGAVDFNIREEMPSGPVAVSERRWRRSCSISFSVQRRSEGQGGREGQLLRAGSI